MHAMIILRWVTIRGSYRYGTQNWSYLYWTEELNKRYRWFYFEVPITLRAHKQISICQERRSVIAIGSYNSRSFLAGHCQPILAKRSTEGGWALPPAAQLSLLIAHHFREALPRFLAPDSLVYLPVSYFMPITLVFFHRFTMGGQ